MVREGATPAVGRPVHRVRHHGHHQRHPVQAVRGPGLPGPSRSLEAPDFKANVGSRTRPPLRLGQRLQPAVGVGYHGHRLQRGPDHPADHETRRPVGPRLQRQGRHDERFPGTRQLRDDEERHQPGAVNPADWQRAADDLKTQKPLVRNTTARITSTRWAVARSGSPRPGRATSSRRTSRRERTSSSLCPKRAGLSGPTT